MASLTHRMKQEDLPPLSSGLMAFSNENSNASPALDEIGRQPRQPVMLPAQPLTYELTNHAVSYIEASQCEPHLPLGFLACLTCDQMLADTRS
jgi:hypothetical protein